MRSLAAVGAALAAAAVALGGCARRAPGGLRPAPVVLDPEVHCWWAAFRTALPPDSVAVRSARAYATLGLAAGRSGRLADTAWAEAGPTVLAGPSRAGAYAARVVAYRRGDTTYYRPFLSVTPRDAATRADSGRLTRERIGFCGEIGRGAQIGGTAPAGEEPDDASPRWRRRP